MTQRPVVRESAWGWASEQEEKIKLQGLPKQYWTKDLYETMSRYGNVINIEMGTGMRHNDAWVIFQYVDLGHDMSFY
jgi:RNA-dependent RNA polymerase